MILYEGNYSGVLEPWRHYIPLKKDHSNFPEVVAVLRDPVKIDEIVTRAYDEIANNARWSFQEATRNVDDVLEGAFRHEMKSDTAVYTVTEFRSLSSGNFSTLWRRAQRRILDGIYKALFGVLLGRLDPVRRTKVHGSLSRGFKTLTFYRWRRLRR